MERYDCAGATPTCVAVVGDGIWVGFADGRVRVVPGGDDIDAVGASVSCMATWADRVAVGDASGHVAMFRDAQLVDRRRLSSTSITAMAFSVMPLGNWEVAAASGNVLTLFAGAVRPRLQIRFDRTISGVACADHRLYVTVVDSPVITVVANGEKVGEIVAGSPITALCGGPVAPGMNLAVACRDGSLYAVKGDGEQAKVGEVDLPVTAVSAACGRAVACIGHFNGVKVAVDGKVVDPEPGADEWAHCLHAAGPAIAWATYDDEICLRRVALPDMDIGMAVS
ncbi:Uncharacterized protein PBTT_04024 [Plasmodiophora brassicae]